MKLATPKTITVSHCLRVRRRALDPWGCDGPEIPSMELGADSISGCRSSKAIFLELIPYKIAALGCALRRFAHALRFSRMCSSAPALAVSTALPWFYTRARAADNEMRDYCRSRDRSFYERSVMYTPSIASILFYINALSRQRVCILCISGWEWATC